MWCFFSIKCTFLYIFTYFSTYLLKMEQFNIYSRCKNDVFWKKNLSKIHPQTMAYFPENFWNLNSSLIMLQAIWGSPKATTVFCTVTCLSPHTATVPQPYCLSHAPPQINSAYFINSDIYSLQKVHY